MFSLYSIVQLLFVFVNTNYEFIEYFFLILFMSFVCDEENYSNPYTTKIPHKPQIFKFKHRTQSKCSFIAFYLRSFFADVLDLKSVSVVCESVLFVVIYYLSTVYDFFSVDLYTFFTSSSNEDCNFSS